jgi:serine/threonine protein kinase
MNACSSFTNPNVPRNVTQLSWSRVRRIAVDAAKGMAYLHYRNPAIIHRDLKSHNLLVDENWKVKVCDFGLSRIYGDTQGNAMTACGTPCWTAPEILRNSHYTTKADVYSFGIVLWVCFRAPLFFCSHFPRRCTRPCCKFWQKSHRDCFL